MVFPFLQESLYPASKVRKKPSRISGPHGIRTKNPYGSVSVTSSEKESEHPLRKRVDLSSYGLERGPAVTLPAGVKGLIAVMKGSDATRALFGGRVHGLEKDVKPQLLVLFDHLRETGLIDGEPFFPTFFFEFFFPGHLTLSKVLIDHRELLMFTDYFEPN